LERTSMGALCSSPTPRSGDRRRAEKISSIFLKEVDL
jgi:hypothetical protein